jgi:hypothetical protein
VGARQVRLAGQRRASPSPPAVAREHGITGNESVICALVRNPSSRLLLGQLRHAACRGLDPELYHPDRGRPADLVLARCADCPARMACLALAFRAEDPETRCGWYGGLGPADRDAVALHLGLDEPVPVPVADYVTRAAGLRAAGWAVDEIASELGCSRRTVQRYLRKRAA